jgi:hypothetical protein
VDITAKESFFLFLSVVGLFATWYFNVQWMNEAEAPSFLAFFREGYVSPATTSMTNDLGVVFVAFCAWVIGEARSAGMKHGWVYIPLAGFVALAVAFPLFLFQRSRALRRAAA